VSAPSPSQTPATHADAHTVAHGVSFGAAAWVWTRIAAQSFGGPAGQIAVMQKVLVDEKRWFSQDRFLHAMSYTMLLPGPEAQQLATYGGWMLHGWRGGLVAGGLFVLPGFLAILAFSLLYVGFADVALVSAMLFGLKPAVLAIVVEAVVRIGRRALKNWIMVAIAVTAFVAIFVFGAPFPWIVVGAGALGYIGHALTQAEGGESRFLVLRPSSPMLPSQPSIFDDHHAPAPPPSLGRTVRVAVLWLAIWWLPVLALVAATGGDSIFVTEGLFFSKVAVVTFGGAYAVLAYIGQQAVEVHGWLAPGEMLDGLGMAETTPGPLIQVVQFVGFMGAYRFPGALDPLVAGLVGSVVTTWVTYAPCFLWIFVGAPYIEHLRGRRSLTAALSGITAAVVGVILNLAIWFAAHVFFRETFAVGGPLDMTLPVLASIDLAALTIGAAAFAALFGLHWGIFRTLGLGVALGLAYALATAS
jgi:chromate transporter